MNVRLVILGLLKQRQLHGYEIKHIIEDHMGDWTSIAFGSIYFAICKLEEKGFIQKETREKSGNRPSRTIYSMTPLGGQEFRRLLIGTWQKTERHYFSFDIALFFADELAHQEIRELLERRLSEMEQDIRHLTAHRDEILSNQHIPPITELIFDHTYSHLQAEYDWLKKTYYFFHKENENGRSTHT